LRACCSWWCFDHARNLVLTTLLHYLSCQEKEMARCVRVMNLVVDGFFPFTGRFFSA
jgi:hypothetical protein